MDNLISLENLYSSLKDIVETQGELEEIRDIIAKLHFIIQNNKLSSIREMDIDIEPLERIATYLLSVLTNVSSIKMKEYISSFYTDGLNIAGLIFELLSDLDTIEPINKHYYLFNCSISYSLAGKEASSAVIGKKILVNIKNYNLFIQDVRYRECWILIGKTFSREFKWIYRLKSRKFDDHVNIWERLSFILLTNAVALVDGNDPVKIFDGMNSIKDDLLEADNIEDLLIISLLYEMLVVMHSKSVWNVLPKHGFSENYILGLTKYDRNNMYEIWKSQLEAFSDNEYGLNYLDKVVQNIIVTMPTSAGKSFLAELAIIKSLERNINNKCIYVAPSRALCGELEDKLFLRFRRLGYNVSSIVDTDDNQFENDNISNSNVIVVTPEKLDLLIRRNKDIINHIDLVIFDEFHKIASNSRGWLLETLITWFAINQEYNYNKIILMSAIVGNADSINIWIGNDQFKPIVSDWSPNRRVYAAVIENRNSRQELSNFSLRYRYHNTTREIEDIFAISKQQGWTKYDICHRFIQYLNDDKILVYFTQKTDLESFVNRASIYMESKNNEYLIILKSFLAQRLGEDHPLTKNIEYGIAYHHGDLPIEVRKEIERHYRAGHISILACTTTLSDGINLPIKNFILGTFTTYYGNKISESDFKNIIGRAGRAYIDTEGRIFLMKYNEYSYGDNLNYFKRLGNIENFSAEIQSALIPYINNIEDILINLEEIVELGNLENTNSIIDYIDRLQVFIFSLAEEYIDIDIVDYDRFSLMIEKLLVHQVIKEDVNLLSSFRNSCRLYIDYVSRLDKSKLYKYNKTGLSFRSNDSIEKLANEIIMKDDLTFNGIESIITSEIYQKLIQIKEFVPKKNIQKKEEIEVEHYNLFLNWINGSSFVELRDIYFDFDLNISNRTVRCSNYIKDMFLYKLPWAFSSLYSFVKDNTIFSEYILKYISAMVKYGVISNEAITLCTLGVESRDLANKLTVLYEKDNQTNKYDSIQEWISQKSFYYFEKYIDGIDDLTIRQIARVRTKLRARTDYLISSSIEIQIAGLRFYDFKNVYKDGDINKNQNIGLSRDNNNPYDEFAVKVMLGNKHLGYVPTNCAEEIYNYIEGESNLVCNVVELSINKLVVSITLVEL